MFMVLISKKEFELLKLQVLMLVLFTIFTITYARLLQRGPPPRNDDNRRQHNSTINELFENLAKNLDQDQKDELSFINSYIFDQGYQYYMKQNQERKEKILVAFLGMAEELDKQTEQENKRIENDIEYFSSLNNTDKDIVLTKISKELERNLNDTTKQFTSKQVLNIIQKQIEDFKAKPDRSILSTWDTTSSIQKQKKEEQELEEIEYQIQEFLDQGLSDEEVKKNITLFINQYFNGTQNLPGDIKNIDQIIKDMSQQEKQKNSTETFRNIRQEIRQIIRDSLREGKSEDEIKETIQEFLNQKGFQNLNQNQKEQIQSMISNEFIRFKRQEDYKNKVSQNSTQSEDDNEDDDPIDTTTNGNSEEQHTLIYVGVFGALIFVMILLFVIRRYKMKQNQSKQIRFKIQESQQEVEQME
ncbi:unnamed protein product (macronuclear) [Paramecium tetraurelia]|uniref:Transmembrane protein n=1 Tax=Paramecium tetraurelia TaxID=5888 RepID=A0C758_PARTE|nr:uncharacterized protein GSPATT00035755001 [Paramecium tetraurelia]CAK66625.1 unnamed protein product [Paramecium tetraurelia]|eukprot:XP_001434022.1 hypothetical protein (macronuclear) [Paramecium tetraurelia strain d4-2]